MTKLHLACGNDYTEGYINVDLYNTSKIDQQFDIRKVPYSTNSVDEIKAFHVIEHFDWFEIHDVFQEWLRVLKPGGRLWAETPDLLETCKKFVEADQDGRWNLYGHLFSEAWIPGQTHKFLFTEFQLTDVLTKIGFVKIKRLVPSSKYVTIEQKDPAIFLNMEAFKP